MQTPLQAEFLACLCDTAAEKARLQVYCYPAHLRGEVTNKVFSVPEIDWYGFGNSLKPLFHGDELCVKPWKECKAKKQLMLRFRSDDMSQNSVEVELPQKPTPYVKFFLCLRGQPERELCEIFITTPCQSTTKDTHGGPSTKYAQPRPSTQEKPRSRRPGERAQTTSTDDAGTEEIFPRKRRRMSSYPSSPDPKRNKAVTGGSTAEDAQPGPSTRGKLRYERPGEMMPTTSKENTRQDVTTSSITESNLVAREKEKSGSRASSLDWMKNISLVESEECTIDDQGKTWNLTDIEAGACITFTPYALSTPLLFRCKLHNPTTDFPPLNEDETLVSSVIGLTCDEQPDIHFVREGKGEVTIALSHSAPKLEGYEVVIREVVSSESGHEWKDLETTNIWNVSDNQDDSAISMVPYAKAKVTHCGSYATIYRLKSYAYSTTASRRKEVTYRITEYPKVSVTIPARNVKGKSKLDLSFKVQEVPPKWFDCGEEVPGPVLHITCSQITRLLEPATITLPMTLKEDKDESSRFSLNTYVIRVFGSRSDNGKSGWEELTEQLPEQAVLTNGVVTFQVKHFSRYTVWLLKASRKDDKKLVGRIEGLTRDTPLEAGFLACLCNTVAEKAHLKVYCYPAHLRRNVKKEVFSTPNIDWYGTGDSQEALRPGEKLRVKLWNGCQAKKELILRFRSEDMFENNEEVQLPRRVKPHVKFFQHHQEQPQQKLLCEFSIATPCQSITVDNHRGEFYAEDAQPGTSNQGGRRSTRPRDTAPTTSRGESYAEDAQPGPSNRGGQRSTRPRDTAPTTPRGEFYAEDAQPGTSYQGGRRSTRPRDTAPTTSGGESYAEDAQPGPSNRGGQRSTRPRDTAPTTPRDSVKIGVPTNEELETISENIAERWKPLGRRLKIKEPKLTAFDKQIEEYTEKAYKMLLHWKSRDGSNATYLVLDDALCHPRVNKKDLAEEICRQ